MIINTMVEIKDKYLFKPSLENVIDSCYRDFERINSIITWLKAKPHIDDNELDYALMRKFRKRIDETKRIIEIIKKEVEEERLKGLDNEKQWIRNLMDYYLMLHNTFLIMDISNYKYHI
jgi:NurA-like 5'-3' nuclease